MNTEEEESLYSTLYTMIVTIFKMFCSWQYTLCVCYAIYHSLISHKICIHICNLLFLILFFFSFSPFLSHLVGKFKRTKTDNVCICMYVLCLVCCWLWGDAKQENASAACAWPALIDSQIYACGSSAHWIIINELPPRWLVAVYYRTVCSARLLLAVAAAAASFAIGGQYDGLMAARATAEYYRSKLICILGRMQAGVVPAMPSSICACESVLCYMHVPCGKSSCVWKNVVRCRQSLWPSPSVEMHENNMLADCIIH